MSTNDPRQLGGLTPHEADCMASIVDAWNQFAALPDVQPDDLTDFRRAIHDLQRILATRAITRLQPDYWTP